MRKPTDIFHHGIAGHADDENGSALLLTLGILSLVLLLGMGFAFSARTNRQLAKVNADQVKARLLAESALSRSLTMLALVPGSDNDYLMRDYTPVTGTDPFVKGSWLVPADYGGTAAGHFLVTNDPTVAGTAAATTEARKALLSQAVTDRLPLLADAEDLQPTAALNFSFLPVLNGSDIIGRYAALVLEESDKLDLNAVMPARKGSGNTPFVKWNSTAKDTELPLATDTITKEDYIFDIGEKGTDVLSGKMAGNDEALARTRNGIMLQECSMPANSLLTQNISSNKFFSELFPSATTMPPWFSLKQVKEENSSSFNAGNYARLYSIFSAAEPAVYRDGSNVYRKFDLSSYEWCKDQASFNNTDGTPDSAQSGWSKDPSSSPSADYPQKLVDALAACTTPPGETAPPAQFASSSFGIPYLQDIKDGDGNSLAKQVAANLVDFCDNDDFVTIAKKDGEAFADIDEALDCKDGDLPGYCGNERVPAVNEILLTFQALQTTHIDSSSGTDITKAKFNLAWQDIHLELLNIYPDDVNWPAGNAKIRVEYSLSVTDKAGIDTSPIPTPTPDPVVDFELTDAYNADKGVKYLTATKNILDKNDFPSGSEYVLWTSPEDYELNDSAGNPLERYEISVTIKRVVVVLDDGNGHFYDFAIWTETGDTNLGTTNNNKLVFKDTDVADVDSTPISVSIECLDPRLNHRPEAWQIVGNFSKGREVDVDNEKDLDGNPAHTFNNPRQNAAYKNATETATVVDSEDYANLFDSATMKTFSTAFIPNRPPRSLWELGAIHRGELFRTLNFCPAGSGTTQGAYDYEFGDLKMLDQVKTGPLPPMAYFNPNNTNLMAWAQILNGKGLTNGDGDPLDYDDGASLNETEKSTVNFKTHAADIHTELKNLSKPTSIADLADIFETLTDKASGGSTNLLDAQKETLIGRCAGLISFRKQLFTILVVAQPLQHLGADVDSLAGTDWDNLKKTVLNPVDYNSKRYSILATQHLIAQVEYDTWTNHLTILRMEYLEE